MSSTVNLPIQEKPVAQQEQAVTSATSSGQVRQFIKNGVLFILVGLALYFAVYAAAEKLNYDYARRNRFFAVKTAPRQEYDYVILGASHAVVFDFEDMNAQLEAMTGSKIINLSNVGAGIIPNRLMLEYFLAGHRTKHIVYFVDSFAFYSREWNEERMQDTGLYQRAAFDPALAKLLFTNPNTRPVALDYTLGFSKINNADRFKSDIGDDEATRFAKTYRPVKQIDKQRFEYLYPEQPDPQLTAQYMAEFEAFLQDAKKRGIQVIVVKPPVPERWYKMLPNEQQFDQALRTVLARNQVEFHDLSLVSNEEKFFYNTDHLNRAGVLNFFQNYLKDIMKPDRRVVKQSS